MISKFGAYFRLASYLARYTNRMERACHGGAEFMEIFDENTTSI